MFVSKTASASGRRRTPGLRRQEVAELAGIGVDWYIRLEQGRSINPSTATIDAIARALLLTEAEHGHLRALARKNLSPPFVRECVPESVARVVANLEHPAYVTGLRWDVLTWNAAATDLFTDFNALAESDRNILTYMLLDPAARQLFGVSWHDEAARMVALFRATHDLRAGDSAFVELVDRLRHGCAEFERWWEKHDVRSIASGRKTLHHPTRGTLCFDHTSFQANDDLALKLVIYTPVPLLKK